MIFSLLDGDLIVVCRCEKASICSGDNVVETTAGATKHVGVQALLIEQADLKLSDEDNTLDQGGIV